jgi:hypothetical protein
MIDPAAIKLKAAEQTYRDALRERDAVVIRLARRDGLSLVEIADRVALTSVRVGAILKKGR